MKHTITPTKETKGTEPVVLFVGPLVPPITGQAVAFTKAYESMQGIKKYVINHNATGKSVVLKIYITLRTIVKIVFIMMTKKVDVVYFTCSRSMLGSVKDVVLIFFARAVGARVVNHLHGADFKHFYQTLPKWYKPFVQKAYERVDESIVLLKEMKEQFADFPKMQIHVVSNFYEEYLEEDTDTNALRDDGVRILYFSNIMATKGIFVLLDAFEKLLKKEQYKKIELHIAGGFGADGEMSQKEVERQFCARLRRAQTEHISITYHGIVTGKEKKELLQQSDIMVLPSYFVSEAMPLSLIEAMATGTALIVTQYNYLPFFARGDLSYNREIPTRDVVALTEALRTYIHNPFILEEAQCKNKLYARQHFSEKEYCKLLQDILNI